MRGSSWKTSSDAQQSHNRRTIGVSSSASEAKQDYLLPDIPSPISTLWRVAAETFLLSLQRDFKGGHPLLGHKN